MTTTPSAPRIALISATPTAIAPAVHAFAARFPEADIWNLLDDKLLRDLETRGGLTSELESRMHELIRYAASAGADGVLLTCSQYGQVVRSAGVDIPVLAPDEAAFDEIARGGASTVLVLASIPSSLDDSLARLGEELMSSGASIRLVGVVSPDARRAAERNDVDALSRALIEAAQPHVGEVDAVFLAQYSLSPAAAALTSELGVQVITGPDTAAERLRSTLGSA